MEIPAPKRVEIVNGPWPTERACTGGGHRKYLGILAAVENLVAKFLSGDKAYIQIEIRESEARREIRAYSAAVRKYFLDNFQKSDSRLDGIVIRTKRLDGSTKIGSQLSREEKT